MSAFDDANAILDEDLLAEVAEHRAHSLSWEATAAAVQWDVRDLRRAIRRDPNYPAALRRALREAEVEADAEGLHKLRELLRDENPETALDAAQTLEKCLSERRRDRTRLAVERLRARARIEAEKIRAEARVDAEKIKALVKGVTVQRRDEAGAEPDATESPEVQAQREANSRASERWKAEQVIRESAVVYLWGGCHKLDSSIPPDATDTPLRLVRVEAVHGRGEQTRYWAVADPVVAHPFDGPFLAPPGCRPAACGTYEGPLPAAPAPSAPAA
jgi:hypothetical protein